MGNNTGRFHQQRFRAVLAKSEKTLIIYPWGLEVCGASAAKLGPKHDFWLYVLDRPL